MNCRDSIRSHMPKFHPNRLGGLARKKLMKICAHLGIEGAAMKSNKEVIKLVVQLQPQIPVTGAHKKDVFVVLAWFLNNQPAVLQVKLQKKPVPHARSAAAPSLKDEFYRSWEWRTLRMEVLKEHGAVCQCCGTKPGDLGMDGSPVRICVDHIKPLAKHWELRLERSNLQILCDECNQGKGAWDETDHRPSIAAH